MKNSQDRWWKCSEKKSKKWSVSLQPVRTSLASRSTTMSVAPSLTQLSSAQQIKTRSSVDIPLYPTTSRIIIQTQLTQQASLFCFPWLMGKSSSSTKIIKLFTDGRIKITLGLVIQRNCNFVTRPTPQIATVTLIMAHIILLLIPPMINLPT